MSKRGTLTSFSVKFHNISYICLSIETTLSLLEKKLRVKQRWSITSDAGVERLQKAYAHEANSLLVVMNGLTMETKHLIELKKSYASKWFAALFCAIECEEQYSVFLAWLDCLVLFCQLYR